MNIILCLFMVIITSYLIGDRIIDREHGFFAALIFGFLIELCIIYPLSLAAIVLKLSLSTLSMMCMTVILTLCVMTISQKRGDVMARFLRFVGGWWSRIVRTVTLKASAADILAIIALVIVAMQAAALVLGAHFDEDDSFYVATATTAYDTDSIYKINPYTGDPYNHLPARYILSPWPMLSAVLARVFRIRPAAVFHTLLPALVIPAAYGAFAMLGRAIWRDDLHRDLKTYGFIIAVSFLQIFSAFSTWSYGMRLLIRAWQGKTVLASVIVPLIFAIVMADWHSVHMPRRTWFLLTVCTVSGCFMSCDHDGELLYCECDAWCHIYTDQGIL